MSAEAAPVGGVRARPQPETIRFRAAASQWLPLFVTLGVALLPAMADSLLIHRWHGTSSAFLTTVRLIVLAFVVVAGLELWVVARWFGVTLTPHAAVVHSLRRRTIPWNRVAAVQVQRFMGGRRVVMYEIDGRRTALRYPTSAPMAWDRHFPEKAAFIGHWWLTHRDNGRS